MSNKEMPEEQLRELEEFMSREDVKFQAICNSAGKLISLVIGDDKTLDAIIAAIHITDKLIAGRRHSGEALN